MKNRLSTSDHYLGKTDLRGEGALIELTPYQQKENFKCFNDPLYFFQNYIYIVHVDKGKVKFDPYEFQLEIMEKAINNRFVIAKIARQSGKTTVVAALLLWYVLFNEDYRIAIVAHKGEQARDILARIKLAYSMLPLWMQQGVKTWNKGDVDLENGSRIVAEATSSGSIRGKTFNIVYMDELAHVDLAVQEDFFTSTYPTITAGKTTKILITSTPRGLEYFYKIWTDSENKRNTYVRIDHNWKCVPGRDENFKIETIKNTSERQWQQEFETDFLGSTDTLIDGKKLAVIPTKPPISSPNNEVAIYEQALAGHQYVICADTGHGAGIDYSAFLVIDVTQIPYNIVARYRNNLIPVVMYPHVIYRTAKTYNNAFCMIERNDAGAQVADILHMDLEYANLFSSQTKGRSGQQLADLSSTKREVGCKITKQLKAIGCNSLKTIVETDKLIINDIVTLAELSTFVKHNNSWRADKAKHDDLVMCLVIFSWLIGQEFFFDMTGVSMRENLMANNPEFIEQDMTPFGIISNGDELYLYEENSNFDIDFGYW